VSVTYQYKTNYATASKWLVSVSCIYGTLSPIQTFVWNMLKNYGWMGCV